MLAWQILRGAVLPLNGERATTRTKASSCSRHSHGSARNIPKLMWVGRSFPPDRAVLRPGELYRS